MFTLWDADSGQVLARHGNLRDATDALDTECRRTRIQLSANGEGATAIFLRFEVLDENGHPVLTRHYTPGPEVAAGIAADPDHDDPGQ